MPYIGNNHIAGDHTNNFKVLDDISSYTATFNGSATSVVDTTNNTIRVVEHRFIQGQRVTYTNGGGGNIGGLTTGTAYFVIFDSASTFKLATSASNAANSTAINLSAVGSGSSHTLNAAFDGVNTKFKLTHGSGTGARLNNSTQINVAINNVVQRPNLDPNNFTDGFALEDNHKIVFQTAPTSEDIFWGSIIANTLTTFDISDHKIDTFTGDGSTTEFTLSHTPANNESLMVTIYGVLQHPSNASSARAYTLIASIIQFTAAPGVGDEIQVRHIGFAGATTADVSGFYGRTGNVVLTDQDDIIVNKISVGTGATIESNGQATFVGVVTFGSSSTTFEGDNNLIKVGTALTLGHTQGLQFHTQNLHSNGFEIININASGIITASQFVGNIGGNPTFSGDTTFNGSVSIGGTLTYEDVTNIDSIGIGTFRDGIDCNGDLDVDGHTNLDNGNVSGVVTFSNSPSAIDMNDNSRISFGTSLKTSIYYNTSASRTYIRNWNDTIQIGYRNTEIYHTNQARLTFDSGNTFSNVVNTNFSGANYNALWVPASNTFRLNDNAKLAFGSQTDTTIHHNNSNLLISNTTGNIDVTGNVVLNNDISVDGHTNLDNVSIAGVTTVAGNIIGSQSQTFIGADTSDGSDNKSMMLGGGGASSVSRGAYVWVKGNEYSGAGGELILAGGGVSSSLIDFYTNSGQRARITSTGELNIGGSYTQTTNKLNVTGTAYVSSDITSGDDIIAADEIRNNVPSDFWASDNTFINLNSFGNITHQGGYEVNITSNGYRDTNGQWQSLAANSNTGAAQIGLQPQGNIIFRNDASKSNGTAHNPTERLRITSGGQVNIGGNYTQTTYTAQITSGSANKKISFGAAAHNDLSDEGAGIFFSRQSDGSSELSGIFAHTNTSLGLASRGNITFHAGGSSTYGASPQRMALDTDGRLYLGSNFTGGNGDVDDLVISGTGNKGITVCSTSGGNTRIVFADGLSGTAAVIGSIVYEHGSTNAMDFYTNALRMMRVDRANSTERLQIGATNNNSTGTRLVLGSGNNIAATAVINTQDANINALTLSNWDGSTTTNKVNMHFDASGIAGFDVGIPAATTAFKIANTSGGGGYLNLKSTGETMIYRSGVIQADINNSVSGHKFVSQCDDNSDGFEIYQQHGSTTTRNTLAVYNNSTGSKHLNFLIRGDNTVFISGNKDTVGLIMDGTSSGTAYGETGNTIDFRQLNEVNQFTGNPAARIASYLDRGNNGFGLKFYGRNSASSFAAMVQLSADYEFEPCSDLLSHLGSSDRSWNKAYIANAYPDQGTEYRITSGSYSNAQWHDTAFGRDNMGGLDLNGVYIVTAYADLYTAMGGNYGCNYTWIVGVRNQYTNQTLVNTCPLLSVTGHSTNNFGASGATVGDGIRLGTSRTPASQGGEEQIVWRPAASTSTINNTAGRTLVFRVQRIGRSSLG